MSVKFAIKNIDSKAEKEGDMVVRYSGVSEPFKRVVEREVKKIGQTSSGHPVLVFTTGLETDMVEFYNWYNKDEKKALEKTIKDLKPSITRYYGGEDVVDSKNVYFWKETRDVSRFTVFNDVIDLFFDTSKPAHALLYLSIVSGAFMEAIAPTKEWAEKHNIPHYIVLETENVFDEEDELTKSDAHAELSLLRRNADPESLFILAWCLQYDSTGFGGFSSSTPAKDLAVSHTKYIDGKLNMKKKRNCPKTFIEYAKKWEKQQTRPAVIAEAYIKAGEWFSYINKREKKYTTPEGTILGNSISEAVDTIMQVKNSAEFEKLRDFVTSKWKD